MVDEYYYDDMTPEEQIELQHTMQDMNYPHPEEKASIFNIFKRILRTKDSSKVGNLDQYELHAVRIAQQVALYVKTLDYNNVSKYFREKGEIVLATSLSSKSKHPAFIEAVITQKRALASDKTLGGKKPWKEKKEKE